MSPDELKEQLAEAIRSGDYEKSTRIALDLIEQLENALETQKEEIRRMKIVASMGRPDYNRSLEYRRFQEHSDDDTP